MDVMGLVLLVPMSVWIRLKSEEGGGKGFEKVFFDQILFSGFLQ